MMLEFTFDTPSTSWDRLFDAVAKNNIAIFLGAGTSIGNGMPTWPQLAASIGGWQRDLIGKLFDRDIVSLSTLCGIARSDLNEAKWAEIVRPCLYDAFFKQVVSLSSTISGLSSSDFGKKDPSARERVVQYFQATNPTLCEIVRMCAINDDGNWRANRRVGALLTTNVDGLAQLCDRALHGSPRILRTVERATAEAKAGKVPLYHLHGYLLPYSSQPSDEAADRLVLTEAEYLDRNDDPYSWANIVLHWAVREFPVLFVGCSMTDELVRRALHRTCHQRRIDYEAEHLGEQIPEKKRRRHFAVMLFDEDSEINRFRNASLAKIGVWPLWVSDYRESLGRSLAKLREHLQN